MSISKVIIVGAGPCGLLLAIMLARNGIQATILDKADRLDDSPRAAFYNTPAMVELKRAGLVPDIEAEAFYAKSACWRTMDNERLFGFPGSEQRKVQDPDRPKGAVLPLRDLLIIMKKHLDRQRNATLLFNHKATGLGQDDNKAWVEVENTTGQTTRMEADYVIGCDGGNSIVRRSLFSDWDFPGFTWDKVLVATNVSRPSECRIREPTLTKYPQRYTTISTTKG